MEASKSGIILTIQKMAHTVDSDKPAVSSLPAPRFGRSSDSKTSTLGVSETIPSKPEGLLLLPGGGTRPMPSTLAPKVVRVDQPFGR
jgi:hypothetical protein